MKEKNSEVEALTESVREAFEEVELTRQTLLNRLAAKELELEKAQHQLEQLRDFQHEPSSADENNEQLALELVGLLRITTPPWFVVLGSCSSRKGQSVRRGLRLCFTAQMSFS